MSEVTKETLHFIEQMIEEDIANGKHNGRIHTRFPPEPNGYLHIGHAKAIWINFSLAQKYGGKTNLRFDDTNPTTEDTEYVDSIQKDIKWLGYEWEGDLFERMKNGEFPDGSRVLRAKVDMTSPNMHMRDSVLYRIKHEHHHRTGDEWCIYPLYDFAHGQSDSIENITHSLCSLEFIHHRPLYDWFIDKLEIFPSKQTEFARMNVAYMITSKRKLKRLVDEGLVTGWDDPRMPTLSGMRRKGYPAAALRKFCARTGVAKRDNLQEIELLEFCVREELNRTSDRVMAVLDPLKVVITNYPEEQVEQMNVVNNPEDENGGTRTMPFSREIYIERGDFKEEPQNKKYYRMAPGKNVRLKGAYIIHCDDFVKNEETGEVTEVHCSYYPESKSGEDTSGVKAKGTLHWVSIAQAVPAEVRMYGRLFTDETPTAHEDKHFLDFYNKESLIVNKKALVEPSLKNAIPETSYQFMRLGYFSVDQDSTEDHPVFNLTVTLKDSWGKKHKKK